MSKSKPCPRPAPLTDAERVEVEHHMPLVGYATREVFGRWRRLQGADRDDITGHLYFRLCRCVQKYDGRAVQLSSYAVPSLVLATRTLCPAAAERRGWHRRRGWRRSVLFSELYPEQRREVDSIPAPAYPADADDGINPLLPPLLRAVSSRQRLVLRLRYGLNGYNPHTLEQVSRLLGITRERVRQIEAAAITEMKHWARTPV